jgi:disulfide bond formation protein DsbB
VELPLIVIVIMIGLAVLFGSNRPIKAVAVIFTVIGFWIATTDAGNQIVAGLDSLARIIQ